MAAVSAVNLVIQKGTYFEETFSLAAEDGLGLNLNNKTVTAKLKKQPTAGVAYTFSTTLTVADNIRKIMPSPLRKRTHTYSYSVICIIA